MNGYFSFFVQVYNCYFRWVFPKIKIDTIHTIIKILYSKDNMSEVLFFLQTQFHPIVSYTPNSSHVITREPTGIRHEDLDTIISLRPKLK